MSSTQTGLYGVVEGFYGRPWSAGQRHTLAGWLRDAGLNAYLYAPKDDARHRALWREPYEPGEASELAAWVRDCRQHGIRFVYALAPGLDLGFTRNSDLDALRAKLKQVHDLGARDFAILFDDINPVLSEADRQRFGTPAAAQAMVANEVLRWARGWDPGAGVLFCPTEYCGRFATPSVTGSRYLRTLGERLAPDVQVLWTGPEIISETIPVASIRELQGVLRRKPILWDNLHANDYDLRRLYLGPYAGRGGALMAEVTGILQNPNCQFEANFVAVRTLGAYVRDPQSYTPGSAYAEALAAWLPAFRSRGGHDFTLAELQLAADIFHLPTEHGELATRYLADLEVILRASPSSWGEATERVTRTTQQITTLYDKATELADRQLLHALYVHLWEIKESALLVSEWMRWRQQNPDSREPFASANFRPKIYRGGFTAALERLMPMDEEGRFPGSVLG